MAQTHSLPSLQLPACSPKTGVGTGSSPAAVAEARKLQLQGAVRSLAQKGGYDVPRTQQKPARLKGTRSEGVLLLKQLKEGVAPGRIVPPL